MIRAWIRVIRIRFLLSSVIATSIGLSLHWYQAGSVDIPAALLTISGVVLLHASVDLLNDYWDFKRGIDTATTRTGMSGGTGVLPEGLLKPSSVYCAGIVSLILGASIGAYFVFIDGWVIAVLLGFAIVSIYFYSTRIVDSGLAEVFVAVKGAMIVAGTYYIQSGTLSEGPMLAGIFAGAFSSLVLFVASFPDYAADKAKGRRTLVIMLGRPGATPCFWFFPATAYAAMAAAIASGIFPPTSLVSLASVPLLLLAGTQLRRNCSRPAALVPAMRNTLVSARIAAVMLATSLIVS